MYENIGFQNKLPDDCFGGEVNIEELREMKDLIDARLKSLENKLRISSFINNIANKEKQTPYSKPNVYFSTHSI